MRKTNQAGIDLIKGFEKLRLKAYQDSGGIWTIGYGHTGPDVYAGVTISREQAEDYLRKDLTTAETGVTKALTKVMPNFYRADDLSDNEFAACVSFAYNAGVDTFAKSSVARLISKGDMEGAADHLLLYNKAHVRGKLVVLRGLTIRREAERKLFLTLDEEVEEAITDDGQPTIIPDNTEPAPVAVPVVEPPSQQTVETGGAGTQVVVGNASQQQSPIVSKADDPAIQASTGSKKSLFSVIIGGLAAIPSAVYGLLQANAEVLKWTLIMAGLILAIYLLRQLILDVVRMLTRADPKRYPVQ